MSFFFLFSAGNSQSQVAGKTLGDKEDSDESVETTTKAVAAGMAFGRDRLRSRRRKGAHGWLGKRWRRRRRRRRRRGRQRGGATQAAPEEAEAGAEEREKNVLQSLWLDKVGN